MKFDDSMYSQAAADRRRKEQRSIMRASSKVADWVAPFVEDELILTDSDVIGAPIHAAIVIGAIERINETAKELKKRKIPVRTMPSADKLQRMVVDSVRVQLSGDTGGTGHA